MTSAPKPCRPEDLFENAQDIAPEDRGALETYLAQFAAPSVHGGHRYCTGCGACVSAIMECLGAGTAFAWGLAYGEAGCARCGHPARGIHKIVADDGRVVASFSNLFLEYLPVERDSEDVHSSP